MSKIYRFIGTVAEVGPLKFERVGQRVEMEDSVANNARIGGCALLTEQEFNSFGFTNEDMKIWADPFVDPFDVPTVEAQALAKAAFTERLQRARALFSEIRQKLVAERRELEQVQVSQGLAQEDGETPVANQEIDKE
jgi:hypothetical protein